MGRRLLFRFNTISGNIAFCSLSILLLFALCSGALLFLFQNKLKQKTIDARLAEWNQAAELLDMHIEQLNTALNQIYQDPIVREFNKDNGDSGTHVSSVPGTYRITNVLRATAHNPLLHLEGLIVHYADRGLAVDQNGSSTSADLFERAYASDSYSASFWEEHLNKERFASMLPAASFRNALFPAQKNTVIPLTFSLPGEPYQLIALWNVEETMDAYLFGDNRKEWALRVEDDTGRLLYQSEPLSEAWNREALLSGKAYVLQDNRLLLHVQDDWGRSYYAEVPYDAAEVHAIRLWAILAFALVVLIALASTYWIGKRLKRPALQFIENVQSRSGASPASGGIREFMRLDLFVRELLNEREAARKHMERQRAAMTNFGYIGLLKNMNGLVERWEEWQLEEGAFDVILYDIRLRQEPEALPDNRPEHAVRALNEQIGKTVSAYYPDAHTLLMEPQQLLTVIRNGNSASLTDMLNKLKAGLDLLSRFGFVTIAVSSRFEHASQCHYAYEQVKAMADQAMLLEETQIITKTRMLPEQPRLSDYDAQLLTTYLRKGQDESAVRLLEAALGDMQAACASARQIRSFTEQITIMISAQLDALRGNPDPGALWTLRSLRRKLSSACSLKEYKEWLIQFVAVAGSLLAKTDEAPEDPTVLRIMDIMETKYAEDLSLDYLAAELNMSPTYLSTYLKEKTGVNFIEHLGGIRMAKATELLMDTSLNINDIGRMVGYPNTTSFNRAFKKWHGIAPGEYRKRSDAMGRTG
ncbi:helix-turn-helix transcriptional regulator [Paenibacillus soyae]|uniref:AraC family transcriptional regulator n=1 Tax=Paenibacillus soyae TaxID=2969249 RepID=A0A9X2MS06_9BACL|nr:AraC family transcriptional regulator [Paenibacillus soyae]MCR2807223.1 AraC family transcriptional regulator [Paenibacillus soyae]